MSGRDALGHSDKSMTDMAKEKTSRGLLGRAGCRNAGNVNFPATQKATTCCLKKANLQDSWCRVELDL